MRIRSDHMLMAAAALALTVAAAPVFAQANPDATRTNAARGRCGDPWVALALDDVYGRNQWGKGLCPIRFYGGGQWNSYAQLVGYVRGVREATQASGIKLMTSPALPGMLIIVERGTARALLPASLIGNDAGSLIQDGGVYLVGQDGGTIIGQDGNSLRRLPVASFAPASSRSVMDSGKRRVSFGPYALAY